MQTVVISEYHLEIFGHRFIGWPTGQELAQILGQTCRVYSDPNGYFRSWIWDDLGVAATKSLLSDNAAKTDTDKVDHVSFDLQSYKPGPGPQAEWEGMMPRDPFPGRLIAFGHCWTPSVDPHSYIRQVRSACSHLGFNSDDTGWHRSQKLQGGSTVELFDPTGGPNPPVPPDRSHEVEVLVRWNFAEDKNSTTQQASATSSTKQSGCLGFLVKGGMEEVGRWAARLAFLIISGIVGLVALYAFLRWLHVLK